MTKEMAVVFIEHTGHVLAAFTRNAVANSKPELEEVVGSELVVRNTFFADSTGATSPAAPAKRSLRFALPAKDILAVKNVPLDEAVLAEPQNHAANGDLVGRLDGDWPGSPNLMADHIEIKRAPNASTETELKVWATVMALDAPKGQTRIQEGTIPASESSVILNLTIAPQGPASTIGPGEYGVMVAVEGNDLLYQVQELPPP